MTDGSRDDEPADVIEESKREWFDDREIDLERDGERIPNAQRSDI